MDIGSAKMKLPYKKQHIKHVKLKKNHLLIEITDKNCHLPSVTYAILCQASWVIMTPMVMSIDSYVTADLAMSEVKLECSKKKNVALYQLNFGLIKLNEALWLMCDIHFYLVGPLLWQHQDGCVRAFGGIRLFQS